MKLVSRRMFLTGAGGAMLALPLLESLLPRSAAAQGTTAPKRLIVLKSFSTQLIQEWYPRFSGNGYQLHDAVYPGTSKADGTTLLTQPLGTGGGYTQAPLTDFQTPNGISGILGPALNPFLPKLNLIRGLDFLPVVNHNYGGLLGNFSSCTAATPCQADSLMDVPTIDQVLAYSPKFYPSAPAVRALHLAQGVTNAMSYSDGGNRGGPVTQQQTRTNPLTAFNDCFQGFMPGTTTAPNRDKLIVDRVREDYVRLKASARLSRADKLMLDQYLTHITELQARLMPTQTLACTPPVAPQSLANNSGTDPTDIVTKWNLMLDIAAAAIMCDRTRIITIGVHKALGPSPNAADTTLQGYYHSEDASGGTWHGLAHDWGNANARRMLKGVNAWVAEHVFAKLLQKLDVMEGGGRTYLDNSLVYWGNELGFNHIAYSVPCLLAGSAGGYLRTGRYLDYIDWSGRAYFAQEMGNVILGIPHNRLLVTILQAMGLSPSDYELGGQPGYGSTSTAGKDPNLWPTQYDLSTVGQVLPGIRAS